MLVRGQQGRALCSEKHKSSFCKVSSSDLRVFVFSFIPLHHNSLCKVGIVPSALTGTGKMFPGICRTLLLCIYKRAEGKSQGNEEFSIQSRLWAVQAPTPGEPECGITCSAGSAWGWWHKPVLVSLSPCVWMCQHPEATLSFNGQK